MILELCTDGFVDLKEIYTLGIKRIELCSALEVGGLTPSASLMADARENFKGEIYCMIRPRAGGFDYTSRELDLMKQDIRLAFTLGIDGVVFGALNDEANICFKRNASLLETANSMGLKSTFHRAIDLTSNILESFKLIEEMGFDHVLTSGGKDKAINGMYNISEIIREKSSKTKVIVGSGVSPKQIKTWKKTKVDGVHFTARKSVFSVPLEMGSEFQTNIQKINSIIQFANE